MTRLVGGSILISLLALILLLVVASTTGFVVVPSHYHPQGPRQGQPQLLLLFDKPPNQDVDFVTKASWYAVEWFGKAAAAISGDDSQESTSSSSSAIDLTRPPQSIQETYQRIQLDNDRYYFLSGQVDMEIYDAKCIFRDPFVSFEGRDRFVENLANLGSFITNYSARVLQYEQPNDTTIATKIMVKLELNLPWKPILAWPWGVTYTIDPSTNLIVDHEESWDIEAWEGVKQIFRKPTTSIQSSSSSSS